MDSEKIFNRVEKKYLISESQKHTVIKAINKHMEHDRYHKADIFNIYYDNDNYDSIIESIERPLFKVKLRARSYAGYNKVFLEIKTKLLGRAYRNKILASNDNLDDNNYGYKRRVLITHQDYNRFAKNPSTITELAKRKFKLPSDIQIAKEIDYLISTMDLKPKILVSYTRESYIGPEDLRITFDTNLTYRNHNLRFTKSIKDKSYFDDNTTIMEIKAKNALPLWLVKILSAEHIYPQTFSKIGKIYEKIVSNNVV